MMELHLTNGLFCAVLVVSIDVCTTLFRDPRFSFEGFSKGSWKNLYNTKKWGAIHWFSTLPSHFSLLQDDHYWISALQFTPAASRDIVIIHLRNLACVCLRHQVLTAEALWVHRQVICSWKQRPGNECQRDNQVLQLGFMFALLYLLNIFKNQVQLLLIFKKCQSSCVVDWPRNLYHVTCIFFSVLICCPSGSCSWFLFMDV